MANPSTTGAGGAGTEVLRRAYLDGNGAATTQILEGVANHIYTILSITFCDQQNAAGTISIWVNDVRLLRFHAHDAQATFTWNDRFVMTDGDDLDVANTVNEGDWWVTYIDQQVA